LVYTNGQAGKRIWPLGCRAKEKVFEIKNSSSSKGAPFDKKDKLKKRGCRWSPGENDKRKAWYLDVPEDELENEMIYLNTNIYPRAVGTLPMDRLTAKLRYSRRL